MLVSNDRAETDRGEIDVLIEETKIPQGIARFGIAGEPAADEVEPRVRRDQP